MAITFERTNSVGKRSQGRGGKEYDCIGFSSESDALQHMLDELVAIYAGNYKSIEKYLRFE